MKRLIVICISMLLLISFIPAQACTIFSAKDGNQVLVGNNEDWYEKDTYAWFLPAEKDKYGRVYFGIENAYPQGGMNDQGLFFDWVAFKDPAYNRMPPQPGKIDYPGNLNEYIIEKCSNVDEVIGVYNKYNEYSFGYATIMITDRTGASATVTWNSEMNRMEIIKKTGRYQVIGYGDGKIQPMFEKANGISIELFKSMLDASDQGDLTQYSNIYDLVSGDIYVYNQHNYSESIRFNLEDELKKGKHMYYIPSLFPDQKPGIYNQVTFRTTISNSDLVQLLVFALFFSLSLIIGIFVYVPMGIIKKKKTGKTGFEPLIPAITAMSVGIMNSLLSLWMIYILFYHGPFAVKYGLGIYSNIAAYVPILMVILLTGQIALSTAAWIRGYWPLFSRIHYSVLSIAVLAALYSLYNLKILIP